jgi:hypothetical protein
MKKCILLFCLCAYSVISLSQTKTASKLGNSSKLSKNDSVMCGKTWKVTSVEESAVITKPPGEKNMNDMLYMSLDGKFEMVLFGEKKAGTWARAGQYINYSDIASGQKLNFKVIKVEQSKLKLDYRNADETHSIFEMEVK